MRPDPDRGIASFPYTMYRGGMTGDEYAEKYELKRPKDTAWGEYLLATIELDRGKKPNGYHWFWGLSLLEDKLPDFAFEKTRKDLPEGSAIKAIDLEALKKLKFIVNALITRLENPAEIEEIDFSGLMFEKLANFSFFIFPALTNFKNTHFLETANFIHAIFYEAKFIDTYFFKNALFNKIEVSVQIDFSEANFLITASFNGAEINGVIKFNQTIFHNSSLFYAATFNQSAHFIGTKFEYYVPRFYNATLNADMIWRSDVNNWPTTERHEKDKTDVHHTARILENRNAYENLASHMKKMDRDHDEHFFFRQETRCRQQFEKNYFTYCSYWLYEKFANYGYGVESAVAAWFWHMVLGAQAIAIVAFANACWKAGAWETAKSVLCSIPLSFANAHGFLPFHKGAVSGCYELFEKNLLFNIIWGFQTILGVILLFLLLLTLRIRFRLK